MVVSCWVVGDVMVWAELSRLADKDETLPGWLTAGREQAAAARAAGIAALHLLDTDLIVNEFLIGRQDEE